MSSFIAKSFALLALLGVVSIGCMKSDLLMDGLKKTAGGSHAKLTSALKTDQKHLKENIDNSNTTTFVQKQGEDGAARFQMSSKKIRKPTIVKAPKAGEGTVVDNKSPPVEVKVLPENKGKAAAKKTSAGSNKQHRQQNRHEFLFQPGLEDPKPRATSIPRGSPSTNCPPNYMILGTRKGGTTALHRYLCASHPNIHPFRIFDLPTDREPTKEELIKDAQVGEVFFRPGDKIYATKTSQKIPKGKMFGESTVSRMINDAETLSRFCSNHTRFFVLLRDPVARCHSQFKMRARLHNKAMNISRRILPEVEAFESYMAAHPHLLRDQNPPPPPEELRSAKNCLFEGAYVVHLRRLLANGIVPRIYYTDDLKQHTQSVVQDALHHLGLSASYINQSYISKSFNADTGAGAAKSELLELDPLLKQRMQRAMEPFDQELMQLLGVQSLPWRLQT